jgi:hypothetical protein
VLTKGFLHPDAMFSSRRKSEPGEGHFSVDKMETKYHL